METKYKELLQIHRSKFANSIEVERLFPILKEKNILHQDDIEEINKHSGSSRVEKLLDILTQKSNSAFQSLCLALESTYPHLLTVMFLGSNNTRSIGKFFVDR